MISFSFLSIEGMNDNGSFPFFPLSPVSTRRRFRLPPPPRVIRHVDAAEHSAFPSPFFPPARGRTRRPFPSRPRERRGDLTSFSFPGGVDPPPSSVAPSMENRIVLFRHHRVVKNKKNYSSFPFFFILLQIRSSRV